MTPGSLDHLVLTVVDIEAAVEFYCGVLGMERRPFGDGRTALHFGVQKINLHHATLPLKPHAARPQPGSADICLLMETPIEEAIAELEQAGIEPLLGPVERAGARGPIRSIYLRDPDGNLVELANLLPLEGE